MEQLGYIVGAATRDQILLDYYDQYKFRHPTANDIIRVAEKRSRLQLDWYKDYWIHSTKTIDYAIDSVWEENGSTQVRIKRVGLMPMPIDLQLNFTDGTREAHYVPLDLMFGQKAPEDKGRLPKTYPAWKWTHATYTISTTRKLTEISQIEIDPSQRMADIDRKNNVLKLDWSSSKPLQVD
jgi:hypothetical protein